MNGFHKRKVVNVNMLAGESPVRLCMQIRLRGSLSFRFHTWLGFLPAVSSIYFISFSFKNQKLNSSLSSLNNMHNNFKRDLSHLSTLFNNTSASGSVIRIGNSMICSDIWHKYHK